MNDTTMHEHVSALADGQLQGEEFARVVQALCTQDELRARWQAYHLVGDVLRSGQHLPCADTARFVARLQQRLAGEPSMPPRVLAGEAAQAPRFPRAEAANQPVFRWKLVAGVASLAAVAAIGWNWIGSVGGASPAGAQLAQQQGAVVAASEPSPRPTVPSRVVVGSGSGAPQIMLRDARLDELLAAHQQAGGASQMPSGFLRNATFEGPSR
jgi:sigma-E factor negative regulatory protein RseA